MQYGVNSFSGILCIVKLSGRFTNFAVYKFLFLPIQINLKDKQIKDGKRKKYSHYAKIVVGGARIDK